MGKKSAMKGRRKKSGRSTEHESPGILDQRFVAATNRPQFRTSSLPPAERGDKTSGLLVGGSGAGKVELDDRFAAVLTDPRFRIGGNTGDVDKYGRKKKDKKRGKDGGGGTAADDGDDEGLDKFYTLKKKDGDSKGGNKADGRGRSSPTNEESQIAKRKETDDRDDDNDDDIAPESNDPEARIAYLTALSRGEIEASSSSSDDSSSADDSSAASSGDDSQSDSDEDSLEGRAGVLDPSTKEAEEEEVEITNEPSPFLAVCNMDWSQVRAVDLFAILSSFCPPGSVRRVRVYPSDFGLERMKKEEVMGPQDIWKKKKSRDLDEGHGHDQINERFDNSDEDDNDTESPSGNDEIDDDGIDLDGTYNHFSKNPNGDDVNGNVDFDPEKLRAYEATKMKYYFAVAEFTSPEAADAAYNEIDGMEVGHSSAMIDLRSIPPPDIKVVVKGREVRDECNTLPSTYESPDFVVAALQQTAVRCTWEDGDSERAKHLTQYGIGNEAWAAMAEGDDLRAYLASDHSSDEDSDVESIEGRRGKGARMRALLGLESDDEDGGVGSGDDAHSDDSSIESTPSSEDGQHNRNAEEEAGDKTMTYVPGKRGLEDRIRSKLEEKKTTGDGTLELTPWEKFQLKRKEKRKERRKAVRARRKDKLGGGSDENNGMYGADEEFGFPESDDEEEEGRDDFFLANEANNKRRKEAKARHQQEQNGQDVRAPSTKEELELLIAGDNDEEAERNFDMRGIARKEKMKSKKLKRSRKRKEAEKAANVSGEAFAVDTTDSRFAAVLDGSDERFGIDRTDPSYKDTPAMQAVLAEQSKRRKAKKRSKVANDVSADAINRADAPTGGAAALSSLVKSLKTKVAKKK